MSVTGNEQEAGEVEKPGPILAETDIRKEDIVVTQTLIVGLISAATIALDRIKDRHDFSSVDIVNRALVVYDLIDEAMTTGKTVLLQDKSGKMELVRIVG